jgi:hypothetical protein
MDPKLQGRLVLDYEGVAALSSPALGPVRMYDSVASAERAQALARKACLDGRATIYDVTYTFPIPTSRTATAGSVTARFYLLEGGRYPLSSPVVQCVSKARPFSHHVHPTTGVVCLGSMWEEARGRMLLAQLVVHVMRIFNHDEPTKTPHNGYSADAAAWWKSRDCAPIHADLPYPVLPSAVTRGTTEAPVLLRRIGTGATPPPHSPPVLTRKVQSP